MNSLEEPRIQEIYNSQMDILAKNRSDVTTARDLKAASIEVGPNKILEMDPEVSPRSVKIARDAVDMLHTLGYPDETDLRVSMYALIIAIMPEI